MQVNLGNVGVVHIDRAPDQCPVCRHGIHALDTNQAAFAAGLERVFRCPRMHCGHFFISRYKGSNDPTGTTHYALTESLPLTLKVSDHSEIIKVVSPDFVAIYAEAETAEQCRLGMVCGPGYRKALEFLIKDYIIRSHQNKTDEIKKLNLGKCITEYVTDEKVKQVAARAVWLGNDETHYLRKWEGKDLTDLKTLIRLTVHWIEMDELTQQALKDMPEGK